MKIRFSHPTKTGGSSVVQAMRTVSPKFKHTHRILLTKVQAEKQGIDFSFATVRHPESRFISTYNYFKDLHKYSVDDFLSSILKGNSVGKKIHYVPQHLYVVNNTYEVDDIIRMESYDEDWNRVINNKIGIEVKPIHFNKTEKKLITQLTSKQRDVVYDIYKEDYKLLGYKR